MAANDGGDVAAPELRPRFRQAIISQPSSRPDCGGNAQVPLNGHIPRGTEQEGGFGPIFAVVFLWRSFRCINGHAAPSRGASMNQVVGM